MHNNPRIIHFAILVVVNIRTYFPLSRLCQDD